MGKVATASLAALVGGACVETQGNEARKGKGLTRASAFAFETTAWRWITERVCVLANDGRMLVVRAMRTPEKAKAKDGG